MHKSFRNDEMPCKNVKNYLEVDRLKFSLSTIKRKYFAIFVVL